MAVTKRFHYIFHGDVQDVGFRWRARQAARLYDVNGWVRNLYDGTVEMEAEGDPAAISQMLRSIEQGLYINIEDMNVKEIPAEGGSGFDYAD